MSFSEMKAIGPPRPDQIEICIFGPSYGECIVVHVGNGQWIVVDSCSYDHEPACLAYFRAIGVDPSTAIQAVVATHWHDDHCKSFSQILSAAPSAHVWIGSVLTRREFLQFAARMGKNKAAIAGDKLSEFRRTIEEIARRKQAGLLSFGFAHAQTQIFTLDASRSGHGYPCQLIAMSPSHGDVLRFLDRLAADMPRTRRKTKIAVPSPTPNHVSMATLLSIGPTSILLGADLENSGTNTAGWEAVISSHASAPLGPKASVYKIPHHGSEDAHNVDVWTQLLDNQPLAALTPWRKGKGSFANQGGHCRNCRSYSECLFNGRRRA